MCFALICQVNIIVLYLHMEMSLAIVTHINGNASFQAFLLSQGIAVGSTFYLNYSPAFSGLVNITIGNRMVSMRQNEFQQIEWQWKK